MATGRRPFTGKETGLTERNTTDRIHEAHLSLRAPNPVEINPRLPVAAASVILTALDKQPEARWQGVLDLLEAWNKAVGPDTIAAAQDGGAVSARSPAVLPGWNQNRCAQAG